MTEDARPDLISRIEEFEDALLAPWVKDALIALAKELPPEGLEVLAHNLAELETQLTRLDAEQKHQLLEVFAKELKRQQAARR